MAIDLAALQTALANDAQYDALVRSGANGELVKLLNADDVTLPKRWRSISVDDFLNAVALEVFTMEQEARIRTYTEGREAVPLYQSNVRTWIQANIQLPATEDALITLGFVTGRLVDPFTEDQQTVSLQQVRQVVRQITKAYINQ